MKKPLPENYDGPILNGHLPLSTADVQSWFRAVDRTVSDDAALPIAELLNQYDLLGVFWRNGLEFRNLRSNNASRKRNQRIAVALRTIQVDLRQMLDEVQRDVPKERLHQWQPGFDLLALVDQIMPHFDQHLPRRGREAEPWHAIARNVGPRIVDAFKSSGDRWTGLGKSTSRAITVLQSALAYLGVHASEEAIADAVRPRRVRKRKGKIRA